MSSLKNLKIRMASVKSTEKITKAMKMVAASKLRKAENAVKSSRPYAYKIEEITSSLVEGAGSDLVDVSPLLSGTGKSKVHLLIVAASDRGLCGGFNSSIIKTALRHTKKLISEGCEVKIITVGKKSLLMLESKYKKYLIDHVDMTEVKEVNFKIAKSIGEKIVGRFDSGEFDVCSIIFSEFVTVMQQEPRIQQLIPINVEGIKSAQSIGKPVKGLYEFEPDKVTILNALLPQNLKIQIFKALLENAASEQGARMVAMDNASRNASEMGDRLKLIYNRTRQAAITKELIEIISGAEAL